MFFFFLMWSKLKNKTICSVMSVKMITSANTLNRIFTSLKTMQGRWNAINHWNESQCYNCWNYNVVKIHWKCSEILLARNLPLFQESRREISLFWGFQTWRVCTIDHSLYNIWIKKLCLSSFRKIKTKNKNPTYLSIFFRLIIWEPEIFFCMA